MSDTATNTSKILQFDTSRRANETQTTAIGGDQSQLSSLRGDLEVRGATVRAVSIDIDRFYDAPPGTYSQMVTALELLKQMIDLLGQATRADDAIESDRFVQRAELLLPKLYACRSIGDGFGILINSLHFGFANLAGKPMDPKQLKTAWLVLRELRTMPTMSRDQAIDRVEQLEESGLQVDPIELADVLEEREATSDK